MKIITHGNGLVLAVCMWMTGAHAEKNVTLQLSSAQGVPITQVAAGQPFIAQVQVPTMNAPEPVLKGFERCAVARSGYSMRSINGFSQATYSFRVVIHEPGVYTLGPAEVDLDGVKTASNTVTITVGSHEITQAPQPAPHKKNEAFLQMSIEKPRVFLGEQVACRLRFYSSTPEFELTNVTKGDSKSFSCTPAQGPIATVETVDGKKYHCIEWNWHVAPKSPGTFLIPAAVVEFLSVSQDNDSDFFSRFTSMLSGGAVRKQVRSQQLSLTVDPLPDHSGPVHGVGEFVSYTARLEPAVATVGSAMVLTLELLGKGNLLEKQSISLSELPEGLKAYESKSTITPKNDHPEMTVRESEYVVQPLQPGSYEIPSQSITYFDVGSRSYKTIYTQPIQLTVKPSHHQAHSLPENTVSASIDVQNTQVADGTSEIAPLAGNGPWSNEQPLVIPSLLFIMLVLLPLGLLLLAYGRHLRRHNHAFQKRALFLHARQELMRARKEGEYHRIYPIFASLADRVSASKVVDVRAFYTQVLTRHGCNEILLSEWNSLLDLASCAAFADTQLADGEGKKLCERSLLWIDELEKIL